MSQRHPRVKLAAHRDFVSSLPCIVCGDNTSTECAHIRMGDLSVGKLPTGMGQKPSDIWVLPLCGRCHRRQHEWTEPSFWGEHKIDPHKKALALWAATGDYELGEIIVRPINK